MERLREKKEHQDKLRGKWKKLAPFFLRNIGLAGKQRKNGGGRERDCDGCRLGVFRVRGEENGKQGPYLTEISGKKGLTMPFHSYIISDESEVSEESGAKTGRLGDRWPPARGKYGQGFIRGGTEAPGA